MKTPTRSSSSTTRRAERLALHLTNASTAGPEASAAAGSSATSTKARHREHEARTRTVAALEGEQEEEEAATVEVTDLSYLIAGRDRCLASSSLAS